MRSGGERPVAFVVGVPGNGAPSPQQLRDGLGALAQSGRLSRYAVPDRLLVVEELPRTSVGKVDKKALRHLAEAGDADGHAA